VKPRLVLGTNNRGKLREYEHLLAGSGFDLVTPADLGLQFDPEETGSTFAENATLKAAEAARISGLPALADDSGLEVDALGGRPGLYSARYAGGDRTSDDITEEQQVSLLLDELAGVPDERRTARFRCAIAIVGPGHVVRVVEAAWEGHIAHEARGKNGFGYDPVFVVPGRDGKTSAELDPAEKNRISHRGQVSAMALKILKELARDAGATAQDGGS
jgi:XTP/dITP diphosphohydrolase